MWFIWYVMQKILWLKFCNVICLNAAQFIPFLQTSFANICYILSDTGHLHFLLSIRNTQTSLFLQALFTHIYLIDTYDRLFSAFVYIVYKCEPLIFVMHI